MRRRRRQGMGGGLKKSFGDGDLIQYKEHCH